MQPSESPCLNLSVSRLTSSGSKNYAIWVLKAPYLSGYVLHDCVWSQTLIQSWQAWQEMFSAHQLFPATLERRVGGILLLPSEDPVSPPLNLTSYSSRLMQHLGTSLFGWLFDGPIQQSLAQSQGIAIGQDKPLRLRLEIRDPDLVGLPWEIMQPQPGKPAISLPGQLLFSRTTSDVDPLPPLSNNQSLNILLVLGDVPGFTASPTAVNDNLYLTQEATTLVQALESGCSSTVKCHIDTLLQPTPEQLLSQLATQAYNIFFYASHGLSAPDGGLLFLRPGAHPQWYRIGTSVNPLSSDAMRSQCLLGGLNQQWLIS
ncbi:MAG: CHAT domain-containing protein [Chroococcidiopsidaceae cyanobacterium CP_BM_RX_35]|nr:CHAT domain-containing protein [Chroococcidiopsidaceae cyanobacterium CP_BM_RX_35]